MRSEGTDYRRFTIPEIMGKGLVVSCQAWHPPLMKAEIMAAFALSAERCGAVGIRANTPEHVATMKDMGVSIPIIGIYKKRYEDSEVYITPTKAEALELAEAGADIIAVDGTPRPRPKGETLESLLRYIQDELGIPVMLDISTVEEAIAGDRLGSALISTTLAGYTPYSAKTEGPDIDMIEKIVPQVSCPVLGEGRFHTPEDVQKALDAGAYAVVVGTALTDLEWRIRQFVPKKV